MSSPYRGRFAPSPTGELHFGSLLAAMASYLRARELKGVWLVRMEDLDPPREVAGAAEAIIRTLRRFGLDSDEPIAFQSKRQALYQQALEQLLKQDKAFWCGCTRKMLPAGGVYPGTCAQGIPAGRKPRSVRFRIPAEPVCFDDWLQGRQCLDLGEACGDFIIRRGDGLFAYQLAVVVDDAEQGISEVVRGIDLIDSTPRQIALYQALGHSTPDWLHLPVAVNELGRKLSKQTFARAISDDDPLSVLPRAWAFLGQAPMQRPASLTDFWRQAEKNWSSERIPSCQSIAFEA